MTPDLKLAFVEHLRLVERYGYDHPLTGLSSLLVIELTPNELRLEIARQPFIENSESATKESHPQKQ